MLALLVQRRRNEQAAKQCFSTFLREVTDVPRVILIDKLKRDEAAKREILPTVAYRQYCSLKNRAECSHPPSHQRERRKQRFTSPGPVRVFSLPRASSLDMSIRFVSFVPCGLNNFEFYQLSSQSGQRSEMLGGCLDHPIPLLL